MSNTNVCLRCNGNISNKEKIIEIRLLENVYEDDAYVSSVHYHYDCFVEIAGEEFVKPLYRPPTPKNFIGELEQDQEFIRKWLKEFYAK